MNISNFLIEHESYIRLFFFFLALFIFGLIERIHPNRPLTQNKTSRWLHHLFLMIINSVILRFATPIAAISAAIYAQNHQIGLFNYFEIPLTLNVILCVILLDLFIYWQHRLFHVIDFLWAIHKVHHADLDIDVTTAVRFHPIEMVMSLMIKLLAILVLGAPVIAVVIFETLLNVLAMFNHSNIRLPTKLDKILRYAIVTRNVHEIHHSTNLKDSQKNFGFHLIWWDILFGSYKVQADDENFVIGLEELQDKQDTQPIFSILTLPFKKRS
ncbi:sterol desaturase family protein [Marinicellulosiphila megalodicopiae]|uniref:sterol desaturase family protein n=1 Tax=Marinicellulosiphila megalodicopiae TaxID=2724896 RepID=UPI003BAF28B0